MPRVSSGLIIAGAYANKIRRVLFAGAKGLVDPKEIARAAGELNAILFEVLRRLGADKGDVIRIIVEYDVEEGKIKWKWDTLELQHFKVVPETGEKAKIILKELLEERVHAEIPEMVVEYLGATEDGLEDIFTVKAIIGGEERTVGAVRIIYTNDEGKGLSVIVLPDRTPCKIVFTVPYSPDPTKTSDNIKSIIGKKLASKDYEEVSSDEAKQLIKELMRT